MPIHEIASALCPQMAKGLLFFHTFTGCDVTSYFINRGKKSAWKTWLASPEVKDSCVTLSFPYMYSKLPEDIILKLERFVVIMYCRTSGDMNVNTAWMRLFSQMSRNIDNIPPRQADLDQHFKRSSYQSGHVWGPSLEVQPELPVSLARGIAIISRQTWNAPHFANVVGPATSGDWNYDTWTGILLCAMRLKRTGNAAVIVKLNIAAL